MNNLMQINLTIQKNGQIFEKCKPSKHIQEERGNLNSPVSIKEIGDVAKPSHRKFQAHMDPTLFYQIFKEKSNISKTRDITRKLQFLFLAKLLARFLQMESQRKREREKENNIPISSGIYPRNAGLI